jgi:hypothetical protein
MFTSCFKKVAMPWVKTTQRVYIGGKWVPVETFAAAKRIARGTKNLKDHYLARDGDKATKLYRSHWGFHTSLAAARSKSARHKNLTKKRSV